MMFRIRPAFAGAVFASLTILAACSSDDNGPTNDDTEINEAEASAITNELRQEIASIASTTNLGTIFDPNGETVNNSAGFRGPRSMIRAACPEWSQDVPTDADEDGIPDDLTATFSPADCIFTSWGGLAVLTLDGAIRVRDVSTANPALRISFDDFTGLFTYNNKALKRVANGSVQLSVVSDGFSGYDSTSVDQELTGQPDASLKKGWSISYTADNAEDFSVFQPLPDGVFDLNGSLRRTWGDKRRNFTVTTVQGLEYDASCVADDRIVGGELYATFDSEQHQATVDIVWNGCGVAPTITIVSGPVT